MDRSRFDELYPTNKKYRRFDQRNTAFELSRKKGDIPFSYDFEEERVKRISKGAYGYTLLDYAFKDAAGLYETIPNQKGGMDTGFYSWKPLIDRKQSILDRWKGSPEEASRIVAKVAKYFGAVGVGFCELDERWVYSHSSEGREIVFEDVEEGYLTEAKAVIPKSHKWVVAMTVPMEFEENSFAPTVLDVTSNMGYSRMHILAGQVAEFIRGIGYHAIPMGNDTALSVPIAIQAGLGHAGRHGRLITWEYGPLVRICKIFTDLPLKPSSLALEGIIEFCEVCEKCARHCPSGAIPFGPRTWEGRCKANNPGVLKWYSDEEACFDYWSKVGSGCTICFRVCSFTKPKGFIHDMVKWFIRNMPHLNRLWVWMDEHLGYGKIGNPGRYWKED